MKRYLSSLKNPAALPKETSELNIGIYLAVAGAVVFSFKPILIKLIYAYGISTEVLMTLRMLFALPVFLYVGWISNNKRKHSNPFDRRAIGYAVLVGVLGYYGAALLDLLGLQYITAQFERMILFLFPTIVCLLSWVIFSERLSKRVFIALPLSYGGIVLIFLHDFDYFGTDAIRGGLLVFASAICFSIYLLFSKPCINKLGSTAFTCIAMGAASVVIFGHFLFFNPLSSLVVPTQVLLLTLALGVIATAIPAFLISAAIARIGSSKTSIVGSIGPIVTAVFAVLLLGEAFTVYHAVGMVLTLAGVIYLGRG